MSFNKRGASQIITFLFATLVIVFVLLVTYVYLGSVAGDVQSSSIQSATYRADLDFWFANFVSENSGLIVDDSPAARQQLSAAITGFVRDPRYVPRDAYKEPCVFEPGSILCDDIYFCKRDVPSDSPCEGLPLRTVDYWNAALLLDQQSSPTLLRVGVSFVNE